MNLKKPLILALCFGLILPGMVWKFWGTGRASVEDAAFRNSRIVRANSALEEALAVRKNDIYERYTRLRAEGRIQP